MKTVTAFFTAVLGASLCVVAITCAHADSLPTSFDCAKPVATVEKLICRDSQLKQMDIELTRLYRLALTDEHSVPRPDKVMVDQDFWTHDRNQCASEPDPKSCIIRSYAQRAYQLRKGSAIVRTRDPSRLTEGPMAFRCPGLNTPLAVTFFTTSPGVVYLTWANTSITLNQVLNESGSRYTGKDFQGNYSFWQNGTVVLFQKPGSGEMTCTAEPIG